MAWKPHATQERDVQQEKGAWELHMNDDWMLTLLLPVGRMVRDIICLYLILNISEHLILKMYEKSDLKAYLWHKKITIISAVNAIERAEPMYEM